MLAASVNDLAPLRERRPIRSFVLRQGRMSPAQQRALDTLMPRYGIPFTKRVIDADRVFGRKAPCVLEIGCGMGETTVQIAQSLPQIDFIGIEVHGPGVGSLLNRIDALALDNVRIIQHDAVEVIDAMIGIGSLCGIHVFFPDPWPKKRHHKRRLLKAGLVHELARRLEPGGYLHIATDWEDYAREMLETLTGEPLVVNTETDFAARPAYRPVTKFELRGTKLGHDVWDLVFRRVNGGVAAMDSATRS